MDKKGNSMAAKKWVGLVSHLPIPPHRNPAYANVYPNFVKSLTELKIIAHKLSHCISWLHMCESSNIILTESNENFIFILLFH